MYRKKAHPMLCKGLGGRKEWPFSIQKLRWTLSVISGLLSRIYIRSILQWIRLLKLHIGRNDLSPCRQHSREMHQKVIVRAFSWAILTVLSWSCKDKNYWLQWGRKSVGEMKYDAISRQIFGVEAFGEVLSNLFATTITLKIVLNMLETVIRFQMLPFFAQSWKLDTIFLGSEIRHKNILSKTPKYPKNGISKL